MTETPTPDLSELTTDGDTLDLSDGRTLRLRIEPDQDFSIMDEQGEGVWCGRLEWTDGRRNDYGWPARPDGFDGGAEIIERDGLYALWWQVPDDLKGDPDRRAILRGDILELLRYGYSVVILEECEGTDAYGRLIVRHSAAIGGVDEFYPELLPDLYGDL